MGNVGTNHADVVVEEKNAVRTKQEGWDGNLAVLKPECSPLAQMSIVSCK